MDFLRSRSIGPATCGIFMTRTDVFTDPVWESFALNLLLARGASRFGQVHLWRNQAIPTSAEELTQLQRDWQQSDLMILAGEPDAVRQYLHQLQSIVVSPSVIPLVMTRGDEQVLEQLRQQSGVLRISGMALPAPEASAAIILDSLLALNYFYEDALARFSLFDLRHLWPDRCNLAVGVWPPTDDAGNTCPDHAQLQALTTASPDLASPSCLVVLRGFASSLADGFAQVAAALQTDHPLFGYAVALPPDDNRSQPQVMVFCPQSPLGA